jgi:Putative prokaryotic signal transducing protein
LNIVASDSLRINEPPATPPRIAARYLFLTDALIAESRLRSADIETFLIDETVARLDWFWLNGLGGVKILVAADDAEDAAELLGLPLLPQFEAQGGGILIQPVCPRCSSLDIAYRSTNVARILASVLALALGWLLLPFTRSGWRCFSCGYAWKGPQFDERPAEHEKN